MKNLSITQAAFDYIVKTLRHGNRFELAAFQPFFLCEQVATVCKCFKLKPEITVELAADALENLYVGIVTEA